MKIIKLLLERDFISYRSLAKKLKINYVKLNSILKQLKEEGHIEEISITVSDRRNYRACRLKPDIREILVKILKKDQI
jgi:DNA-binding Lrp family transcriptional regulator